MANSCIFCKIVAGEIPAKVVYQDDLLIAFHDVNPQAPHHLLLVPRKHIATTLDLDTSDAPMLARVFSAAAQLSRELGFAEDGFRLVNNCNRRGGQVVWHLHFHLLGGRDMTWPPG
jgi:histidine triad (HIT) family protein